VAFELPKLPYAMNALAPFISEETLEYNHGKHLAAYVAGINRAMSDAQYPSPEALRSNPAALTQSVFRFLSHERIASSQRRRQRRCRRGSTPGSSSAPARR
jgi:superoxide dismutase, Fe-Mn family